MPITLAKIAANTADVQLTVGEDVVNITYYPNRITEKLYADLNVIADPTNTDVMANAKATNGVLVQIMKSWDVLEAALDADGKPLLDETGEPQMVMFPITLERMPEVPYEFRVAVMNAIFADMREKKAPTTAPTQNSSPSADGSPPTD